MAKTLHEAAADVLAASIKNSHQDQFGAGTKLFRSTGTNAGPEVIDMGGAHTKTDQAFPDFTRGVPTAKPPGATPPVSAEKMHTIEGERGNEGKQPQKSEGAGKNKGIEGSEPKTAQQHADRAEDNKFHKPVPGTGMKQPTWGEGELFTDEEIESLIAEAKRDGYDKEDFVAKSKGKFGKHMQHKKAMSTKQAAAFKEALDLSDEDLEILFETDEETATISDSLKVIAAEILGAHQEAVAEDVNAIFSGESLSEEFKSKVSTIFNAAITSRVNEVVAKLETVIVEQLDRQVEAIKEELTESVDEYLNYMADEWVKENEIAIQKGLKAEIVEDFIVGLKNLFVEHYIDIPEDKMDLVAELQEQNEALEASLNEEIRRNAAMKKALSESKRESVLAAVCEGLTDTQTDKVKSLAESVEFVSEEDFRGKIETLKEGYFPVKVVRQATDALDQDAPEVLAENVVVDPRMNAYVSAIHNLKK